MNISFKHLCIFLSIFLLSCASQQQRDAYVRKQNMEQDQLNRSQHTSNCLSYGFKSGTNEFANCMQQEDLKLRSLPLQNNDTDYWTKAREFAQPPVFTPVPCGSGMMNSNCK